MPDPQITKQKLVTGRAGSHVLKFLFSLLLIFITGVYWSHTASAAIATDRPATIQDSGDALSAAVNTLRAPMLRSHERAYFAPVAAGAITNTVSVGSTTTDPNPLDNTDVETTTVTSEADLAISKSDGVGSALPGTAVTYTIIVTNTGPSAVTGALISDTLSAAISSASWSCSATVGSSCDAATGTGTINTMVNLALNGRATFILVANIASTASGTLVNTASVTPPVDTIDPDPTDDDATDTDNLLTGILTGTVFLDGNDNNVQNTGEGLPNVTVIITTSVGTTLTVITHSSGRFTVTVPAGTTIVDVDDTDLPTGTVQIAGTDPTTVNVPAGGSVQDINGYEQQGDVIGHLFEDTDGNGSQNGGEPDLANVDVVITDAFGVTQTVTTDGSGNYTATVPIGSTIADVDETTLPAGAVQTAGTDPTTVNVTAGSMTNAGNDGYQMQGLVEGVVYMDEDGDGVYTPGIDTPLPNVSVIITDSNGVTYTVITTAGGAYTLTVPAGNTIVDVVDADLPASVVLTGGSSDPTTVNVPGGSTATDDTGYVVLSHIGDYIWLDLDGDGVQDANEPGLANVIVALTDSSGNTITTTTGPNGNYNFAGLDPDTYTVTVNTATLPAGVIATDDRDATANGQTVITVLSNSNITDADFGYQGNASIGDRVWHDRDGNGVQQLSESGLSGIVITVTMQSGWVITATTSITGFYEFGGLIPGTYTVTVDTSTLPTGSVLTTANDPLIVTLADGENDTTANFGYQRQGDVIGHIFEDTDGNGVQNGGESDLPNITIIITDSRGITQAVTTDASGNYTATVVIDSPTAITDTITVDVDNSTLPVGSVQTAGTDPDTVTVTAGATTSGGDDGYQQQGVVDGRVYEDVNSDGNYDAGTDIPLVGIDVLITDSNGVTYTVATNGSGYFSLIVPGGSTTVNVINANITATNADLMLENGFTDPVTINVPASGTATTEFPYVEPLVIDKDAVTATVVAGEQVTYTVVIRNIGAGALTNVVVSDTLPVSFTYASSSIAAKNASRTVTTDPSAGDTAPLWGVWTLNAGGAVTITFAADVASDVADAVVDNTAYADSDQTSRVSDVGNVGQDDNTPPNDDPENDEDVIVTTQADLSVTKSDDPDPVTAGRTLTYTIVVSNAGPSDAQNVVITDTLPADLTFQSASAGCSEAAGIITCTLGTVPANTTKTIVIVVTVDPDLLAMGDGAPMLVVAPAVNGLALAPHQLDPGVSQVTLAPSWVDGIVAQPKTDAGLM